MLQGNPQGILDNLHTAVLTLDEALRLTSVNAAAEMLFELSAKQLLGQPLPKLLPENDELAERLRAALADHHPLTHRGAELRLPSGRAVSVDYTITPLGDGEACTELLLEIAEVERLIQLARGGSALDQQAANRAVLRGLAHEIKNPLGGLRGAAQLLARELTDRGLKEYTRIIIHEADRLRNLVDRMMGGTQPLKRVPVNIHRVLEHVRSLITVEFPNGPTVERRYDPSVPELVGDPDQITQAVLNIARNSAEAVGEGGTIVLRTRVERQFTIGQRRHRLVLCAEIEDDGPGIAPELIDRVFYPMVTDKPQGSGLGLSIAQDIVSRHGGMIDCESRPGRTVFSIYLPLEPAA